MALNVGVPMSSCCIMRQLYRISAGTITTAGEHRNSVIDLCLGFGIPVLQMSLCKV